LQGFAQNFSSNYSVQLRTFLLSPALQRNLRIFFADPNGGGGTLMEAAGIRLNISALTVEEWRVRLQNYFQGNFRYSEPSFKILVCLSALWGPAKEYWYTDKKEEKNALIYKEI
jgi:hypothetical protein